MHYILSLFSSYKEAFGNKKSSIQTPTDYFWVRNNSGSCDRKNSSEHFSGFWARWPERWVWRNNFPMIDLVLVYTTETSGNMVILIKEKTVGGGLNLGEWESCRRNRVLEKYTITLKMWAQLRITNYLLVLRQRSGNGKKKYPGCETQQLHR
jgi:hypothetical protein